MSPAEHAEHEHEADKQDAEHGESGEPVGVLKMEGVHEELAPGDRRSGEAVGEPDESPAGQRDDQDPGSELPPLPQSRWWWGLLLGKRGLLLRMRVPVHVSQQTRDPPCAMTLRRDLADCMTRVSASA